MHNNFPYNHMHDAFNKIKIPNIQQTINEMTAGSKIYKYLDLYDDNEQIGGGVTTKHVVEYKGASFNFFGYETKDVISFNLYQKDDPNTTPKRKRGPDLKKVLVECILLVIYKNKNEAHIKTISQMNECYNNEQIFKMRNNGVIKISGEIFCLKVYK